MTFWRNQVIQPALSHETRRHIDEQLAWIARDPADARHYYHLAQLYRLDSRMDEALALLLESVRLDPAHAHAHVALVEMYAVAADYRAAWRHARLAETHGDPRAIQLLTRHRIAE